MKQYKILGFLYFVPLLVLAILFYRERMIFADSAYYSFNLLNTESFFNSGRLSAAIAQIIPLIILKLGGTVKAVLLAYSVSFILVYSIIYAVCTYVFKNIAAGFSLSLIMVLCIRHTFYNPVTETHLGMAVSLLLLALLCRSKPLKTNLQIALAIGLIILGYFTHPVTFFTNSFVLGYVLIKNNDWKRSYIYALGGAVFILGITKTLLTGISSGESELIFRLTDSIEILSNLTSLFSYNYFVDNITGRYFYVAIVFLITTFLLIKRKKYLMWCFMMLFTFIFILTNIVIYHAGESGVVMEKSFLPMCFFIVIPFCDEGLDIEFKFGWYKVVGLTFLCFMCIRDIGKTSKDPTRRLNYSLDLLDKLSAKNNHKYIIDKANLNMEEIKISWSYSFETLLLSSLKQEKYQQTVFIPKYEMISGGANTFLGAPFILNIDQSTLNKRFFRLPELSYVEITKDFKHF